MANNDHFQIDRWILKLILLIEEKESDIKELYKKVLSAKNSELKTVKALREAEKLFADKKLCQCEVLKFNLKHIKARDNLIRIINTEFVSDEIKINLQLKMMAKHTNRLIRLQNRYINKIIKQNIIKRKVHK